jgi:hypothetical protein
MGASRVNLTPTTPLRRTDTRLDTGQGFPEYGIVERFRKMELQIAMVRGASGGFGMFDVSEWQGIEGEYLNEQDGYDAYESMAADNGYIVEVIPDDEEPHGRIYNQSGRLYRCESLDGHIHHELVCVV